MIKVLVYTAAALITALGFLLSAAVVGLGAFNLTGGSETVAWVASLAYFAISLISLQYVFRNA
jgi:hypothetical protein